MKNYLKIAVVTLLSMSSANMAEAQTKLEIQDKTTVTEKVKELMYEAPKGKEIYIPSDLKDNDFTRANSKWSFARCA